MALSEAARLWASLSRDEQITVAHRVARARSGAWKRAHPNVVAISSGVKYRRGRRFKSVICLRFLVRRKWKHPRKGAVPRVVRTVITRRGLRRLCLIPTDVLALGRGRPHNVVVVRPPSGLVPLLIGTACCRVRVQGERGARFLLGCHHVFTLSKTDRDAAPLDKARLFRLWPDGTEERIGALDRYANLTPALPRYGMDAALVRIENDNALRNWSVLVPSSVSDGASVPEAFWIFTPGRALRAQYEGVAVNLSLDWGNGVEVRIRTAYESIAKTQDGDSGSPVISDEGVLLGMHFYGLIRTIDGRDQKVSLAIPAHELFSDSTFGVPIQLAP
jgi:hypothetical protein